MTYLESSRKQFEYYKMLGEKTFAQVPEEALFWQYNAESNSMAMIVQHLTGNMLSRWTDFRTTDGEKPWRDRDGEFENNFKNNNNFATKRDIVLLWNKGWLCLFEALDSIRESELDDIIYIRNEKHTLTEAINRQLAHYPYHVGQLVFIAKMCQNEAWQSLSIPRKK
jgi:hypothetical protein